jgi:hypothetical protein
LVRQDNITVTPDHYYALILERIHRRLDPKLIGIYFIYFYLLSHFMLTGDSREDIHMMLPDSFVHLFLLDGGVVPANKRDIVMREATRRRDPFQRSLCFKACVYGEEPIKKLLKASALEPIKYGYIVDGSGYFASSAEEQRRLTLRRGMTQEEESALLKERATKCRYSLVRHNIVMALEQSERYKSGIWLTWWPALYANMGELVVRFFYRFVEDGCDIGNGIAEEEDEQDIGNGIAEEDEEHDEHCTCNKTF